MSINSSQETRSDRKAAFSSALQKLRGEFPLEERITSAAPAVRAAYAEVLLHWLRTGLPPGMDIAPEPHLKALAAMDAVVLDEHGVSCYPFSARETGIRVLYSGRSVQAMCAIDALAIPRLMHCASRVTARCAVCRCRVRCSFEANGSLAHESAEGVRVAWQPRAHAGGPCCDSLCSGIGFLCKHCAVPEGAASFTLPEAAALGNAFFAFQRRLLDHYERL